MIDSIPEIAGSITVTGATLWLIARQLISHFFEKQKELKSIENKLMDANAKMIEASFRHITSSLEKDILSLGYKLKDFETKIDNRIIELIKLETKRGI